MGNRAYYVYHSLDTPFLQALGDGVLYSLYTIMTVTGTILFCLIAPILSFSETWPYTVAAMVLMVLLIVFSFKSLPKKWRTTALCVIALLWFVYGLLCFVYDIAPAA
jgi:sugar phosphate permease